MTIITVQLPGSPGSPGPKGDPGPLSVMTIDPSVVTGAPGTNATATITGVAPNQIMHLTLPRGDKGDKGDTGITPTISSGTINTGAPGTNVIATLTGTAPDYLLNLTIPRGATGNTGPANTLAIGTVTAGVDQNDYSASITGTAPSQTLNLKFPRGLQGVAGPPPNITLGAITTGDAGTTASATITGTTPNYTLNLTIPKGDPGIPGTAGGSGQGVPQGGATGAVLSKLGPEDFNHGWVNSASAGTPNTIMKRDANGRATVVDPLGLTDIATKQSSEAAAAAAVTTHNNSPTAHGVTGAVVGTTNTQTLTNKTLTLPTITNPVQTGYQDLTAIVPPSTFPAAGRHRLYLNTNTNRLSLMDSTGAVKRQPTHLGTFTNATKPITNVYEGDTFTHAATNSLWVYTAAGWRAAQTPVQVTGIIDPDGDLAGMEYVGLHVFETFIGREYVWNGAGWEWWHGGLTGGTPPTLAANVVDYQGGYHHSMYVMSVRGDVTLHGLVKLNVSIASGAVFTLATGLPRPDRQVVSLAMTSFGPRRVDILPTNGNLTISNDSGAATAVGAWVSLQSIQYQFNQFPNTTG